MQHGLDAGLSYKDKIKKVGYTNTKVRVDVLPIDRWPRVQNQRDRYVKKKDS